MKISKFNILSLSSLLLFLLAGCQTPDGPKTSRPEMPPLASIDRTARPKPGPAPEAAFPAYKTYTLSNGLKLYVVSSDRQPTISYRLMFRSGSLFDGEQAGLSELLASMLDKGVEGKTAYELASEIDFIGGSVGAAASSDFIAVSVSGLSKYKEVLIDTLADVALRPTFPEEELQKLKSRTLSNLVSERRDPGAVADKLRRKLVYGDGGYGSYMTEESVASISKDVLAKFHEAHFLPNNASLAVVGDVDPEEIRKLASATFGEWETKSIPSLPDYEYPTVEGVTVHLVDRPESVQSVIRVAQQSVARDHEDSLPLSVVMSVLGGGFSGRMYQNLREDKGYTYGCYSFAANAARFGAIVTSAEVRNDVTAPAVQEMLFELDRIKTDPIGEEELSMHRQYLSGNYLLSLENPMTTARRVQEIEVYGLKPNHFRDYVSNLVSVGRKSAQSIASKHIESDDLVVAVVGNAALVAESLSEIGPIVYYNEKLEVIDGPAAMAAE